MNEQQQWYTSDDETCLHTLAHKTWKVPYCIQNDNIFVSFVARFYFIQLQNTYTFDRAEYETMSVHRKKLNAKKQNR